MKRYHTTFLLAFILAFSYSSAQQTTTLTGVIKDANTNELLPFTNIIIFNTTTGTSSNEDGRFEFTGLNVGFVRLQVSSLGYEPFISEEILLSAMRPNYVEIALTPTTTSLEEVRVVASPFAQRIESPLSLQRIGLDVIERSAGASRDFSKVLQSFPGVGSTTSFRNELIVRGGGPAENRFYLDGIEIPVLNHFSTQGASGGPVGILNVDFIREVDFYSSAFPASRGNALSSVFEFRQIDPNPERPAFKATVGASELSLSVNTPITENTSGLFSVRRSYLQFLFDQLGLPFLPTFNDFQFVTKTKLNRRDEITFLGVGALDQFRLNSSPDDTEENRYILSYLPVNEQWNYTLGASYRRFIGSNNFLVALSRNHLNNTIFKYADNDDSSPDNLLNDYVSDEIENKLRFEFVANPGEYRLSAGFNLEHANYYNRTTNRIFVNDVSRLIDYETNLDLFKYGVFGSVSRRMLEERLRLSGGVRVDANSFSSSMRNPLDQISPRASASYAFLPEFLVNASVGRYYQLPPYTTLGFRDENGVLQNRFNNLKYIRADHFVAGFEYRINSNTRATIEGFRKRYADYPLSVNEGISLASKGADFGVLGDEEVTPDSKGRAYGAEFLIQRRSPEGLSYILAYTWVNSEFTDASGDYVASSWDSGHLLTLTVNKNFNRNWDAGLKWRYIGALPYTPFDRNTSELVEAWDVRGREYLDFSRFNQERLDPFHQLDLRVDKTFFFERFSLGLYLDIQNVYNFQSRNPARLVQALDENDSPIIFTAENDSRPRYELRELRTSSGTVLPSIGVILEF
ncbi:TonB-dependent receptor [Alkalitalea saponilacus]|uniref:TonB-dependent Receptor Plug Domain n=1 Tax=Alkalitalea saponilacus TaxID=889453 RepID=A0A1T5CP08_9BACT|nr:TonB-dependent receptor [Alkalitalea saponilacus]ASB49931.1 TonB-dependent receptor [Alkalitalea saponilacus]SKB61086.1 TonB-dependent Receptor Plug Domain [Alkalitalea saponilacus]